MGPIGAASEMAPLTGDPTEEGFNMELLTRQDPMVFFSEIHFFEDELNDFGHCAVNVKLRVMKEFFFLLLRYTLRVDGVLVRVRDVRLMHEFSKDYMLKELQLREKSFGEFSSTEPGVAGSFYDHPDALWGSMKVVRQEMVRVPLPPVMSSSP